jgi:hypothetical protein
MKAGVDHGGSAEATIDALREDVESALAEAALAQERQQLLQLEVTELQRAVSEESVTLQGWWSHCGSPWGGIMRHWGVSNGETAGTQIGVACAFNHAALEPAMVQCEAQHLDAAAVLPRICSTEAGSTSCEKGNVCLGMGRSKPISSAGTVDVTVA